MSILTAITENLILPIKCFKPRYLPIIIIYFCYGFSGFAGIAEMFWVKDNLTLSASELAQIAFWVGSPWTLKIIFSQLIDNISILGNRRKSYIVIGAMISFIGKLILVGIANKHHWIEVLGSVYNQLILSGVLMAAGLMIQDLVADTLCSELVNQDASPEEIKFEVGIIQILGRISLMCAIFLSVALGGYIASHYSFTNIIWWALLIPPFSLLAAMSLSVKLDDSKGFFNMGIAIIGVAIVAASIISEILSIPYNQEIIFVVNCILILLLFKIMCRKRDTVTVKEIALIGIMLFAYRLNPPAGAGIEWWQIDELKFDPAFFGVLRQVNFLLGIIGTWAFSGYLLKKDISVVIVALTLINALLFLPDLGMAFGLHKWTMQHFGFGAKTIALVDTVIDGPFTAIIMVPLLALSTYYAPKYNKPTWFAFTACWFNLALSGSVLISKYLNKVFVIERGQYSQIGGLLLTKFIIGVAAPLITVWICNRLRAREAKLVVASTFN